MGSSANLKMMHCRHELRRDGPRQQHKADNSGGFHRGDGRLLLWFAHAQPGRRPATTLLCTCPAPGRTVATTRLCPCPAQGRRPATTLFCPAPGTAAATTSTTSTVVATSARASPRPQIMMLYFYVLKLAF